jgi:hypothetical protein
LSRVTKLRFLAVLGDGQTVGRADVDAGVALDAELRLEHRLHVAVEATLDLVRRLLGIEAELDLDAELLEALPEAHVRHEPALHGVVLVLVRPLVQPHLAARQVHRRRQTVRDRLTHDEIVHRDRGLVAVLDGPDDVLRAEGGIAAEEHIGPRRLVRRLVHDRDVPLVELETEIVLDPRKCILLADREHDIIGRQEFLADDAFGGDAAVRVEVVLHAVEPHADELAVLDDELLR